MAIVPTRLMQQQRSSFRVAWLFPLALVILTVLFYAVWPNPSNPLHQLLFLSYPLSANDERIPLWARVGLEPPQYYGKGVADISFVVFYTIVFLLLREVIMQRLLRPMARKHGLRSRSRQNRYMEQMYTAIYFSVFGPLGVYIMRRTPVWYFNTAGMYESYPHRSHDGLFKAFYLLQASYWAQQAVVMLLDLEKRRKDFYELIAHHVVTLMLIFLSYRFHFTYIGLAVFVSHDVSDFFLAVGAFRISRPLWLHSDISLTNTTFKTSLTLSYVKSRFVVPYFFAFIAIWTYARHYLNLRILYSVLTEFKTIGPFELDWETEQYKCWISQVITFPLLAILQGLNLFWLFVILRIAYYATFKNIRRDMRSDEEEDAGDEGERRDVAKIVKKSVETADSAIKSTAISTGVSLS